MRRGSPGCERADMIRQMAGIADQHRLTFLGQTPVQTEFRGGWAFRGGGQSGGEQKARHALGREDIIQRCAIAFPWCFWRDPVPVARRVRGRGMRVGQATDPLPFPGPGSGKTAFLTQIFKTRSQITQSVAAPSVSRALDARAARDQGASRGGARLCVIRGLALKICVKKSAFPPRGRRRREARFSLGRSHRRRGPAPPRNDDGSPLGRSCSRSAPYQVRRSRSSAARPPPPPDRDGVSRASRSPQ